MDQPSNLWTQHRHPKRVISFTTRECFTQSAASTVAASLVRAVSSRAFGEEVLQSAGNEPLIYELALPDNQRSNPLAFELLHDSSVSPAVALEFLLPERPIALRCRSFRASLVPMPETTMYEDGPTSPSICEVRRPWKAFASQPIPATQSGNNLAYRKFRSGALTTDATHFP